MPLCDFNSCITSLPSSFVSMASDRPCPSATTTPILTGETLRVSFQWPLIGHAPLRHEGAPFRGVLNHRFQWPLIGHAPLRRPTSGHGRTGGISVSMASDRPCPSATKEEGMKRKQLLPVSMASDRPCPSATSWPPHGRPVATVSAPFQWPLIGHAPLRRGGKNGFPVRAPRSFNGL